MDLGLKGRKAIVTGGSRGLGRAAAETFAAEGCDVAICSRGAEGVEEAKKSLEAKGVKVFGQAVDVGDKDALEGFIAAAIADLGGLDILVSNPSGGNGVDEKSWKGNFDVDLMGAVRSVNAAVGALSESDAASVTFISSTAALETFMGPTSYNAIKAGLITHANGLSQALARKGIRVFPPPGGVRKLPIPDRLAKDPGPLLETGENGDRKTLGRSMRDGHNRSAELGKERPESFRLEDG